MNWNQIMLSLMVSATLRTALATVTFGWMTGLSTQQNIKYQVVFDCFFQFSIFQFLIKLLV